MSKTNINQNKGWAFRWTKEEDDLLIKNYSEKTIDELLGLLPKRNKKGIYSRAHALGLKYHTYNKDYFEVIDTEDKAYWLGFLYTDGYVTTKYRWGVELSIVDYDHLVKLNQCLESNITIRTRTRKEKEYKGYKIEETSSCSLDFKNKKMYEDLVKNGVVPNKTAILQFPKEDILPKHLRPHFIRGLFDGDGTFVFYRKDVVRKDRGNKVYNRLSKEIAFVCKSQEFIDDLKMAISEDCGVEFRRETCSRDGLGKLRLSKAEDMKAFLDYLYVDAETFLDRKHEKANEILDYCRAL